jgi:hypothetical protein
MSQVTWSGHLPVAGALSDAARADLVAVMDRLDPQFFQLMDSLAREIGLDHAQAVLRRDAIVFEFGAIQLADDLADDDCAYLQQATRRGPGAQWLLQHLFYACMLQSTCSTSDLSQSVQDLIQVGAAQQLEVRRNAWDLESSTAAALGLNGLQFAAYFRLLASGTRWSDRLPQIGRDFGFALHVVSDIRSGDRRWTTLSQPEQQQLATDAAEAAQSVARAELSALAGALHWFAALLKAAQELGLTSRA